MRPPAWPQRGAPRNALSWALPTQLPVPMVSMPPSATLRVRSQTDDGNPFADVKAAAPRHPYVAQPEYCSTERNPYACTPLPTRRA